MTQRERILAISMGVVVGGAALFWVGRTAIFGPIEALKTGIKNAGTEQTKLRSREAELRDARAKYIAHTRRTLHGDPKEAQLLFSDSLHKLLHRNGLADDPTSKATKITPGSFAYDKYSEFYEVPLSITASGTLSELVNFLCDFYRLPYMARLERVTITADPAVIAAAVAGDRGGATGGSGTRRAGLRNRGTAGRPGTQVGPDGPELTITIKATTLVMPKLKDEKEHAVIADPHVEDQAYARLPQEKEVYAEVFRKSLFKPWQPEQPPEQTPPDVVVKPPDEQVTPEQHTEVVNARLNADRMFVRAVDALAGNPLALVVDESNPGALAVTYHNDDALDDGKILLIHRRGLVVRSPDTHGGHMDYFYPLGKSFADREALSPEEHPQIWRALEEAFVNWDEVAADSGRV